MSKVNRDMFQEALSFIHEQMGNPYEVRTLEPKSGYFILRPFTIVVSLPESKPNEDTDYEDSLCTLFHEFGHWLQMIKWYESNKTDRAGKTVEDRICCYQVNQHRKERSGDWSKDNLVQFETEAWSLGLKGIEGYEGIGVFLEKQKVSSKDMILEKYPNEVKINDEKGDDEVETTKTYIKYYLGKYIANI